MEGSPGTGVPDGGGPVDRRRLADRAELKSLRAPLERCGGAIVSRSGCPKRTRKLRATTRHIPSRAARAASKSSSSRRCAPQWRREIVRTWFSWRWLFDDPLVERLVSGAARAGRTLGWVTAPASALARKPARKAPIVRHEQTGSQEDRRARLPLLDRRDVKMVRGLVEDGSSRREPPRRAINARVRDRRTGRAARAWHRAARGRRYDGLSDLRERRRHRGARRRRGSCRMSRRARDCSWMVQLALA